MEKTILAHGKVNLYLKVTGKRSDGYHLLRSFFHKISLCDELTFFPTKANKITIKCSDPNVPLDESNLAVKAAKALAKITGCNRGVLINIVKHIPIGSGLGGGSSNAAATLLALNNLWKTKVRHEDLLKIALNLGADVPFFTSNYSAAWIEGIGEVILPVSVNSSLNMVLFKPDFPISSSTAFTNSKFNFVSGPNGKTLIEKLSGGDPFIVGATMQNDLQPWAFDCYRELAELKTSILRGNTKPSAVTMTGSGSTLMALYENSEASNKAYKELSNISKFVKVVTTLA